MDRMMQLAVLRGIARYEFRMQVRRRSVWVVMLGMGLLVLLASRPDPYIYDSQHHHYLPVTALEAVVTWAISVNTLLPLGLGILLADRLPRDEHLILTDLFAGLPIPTSLRLLGKYLGATLAALLPIVLVFAFGLLFILLLWHDAAVLPQALAAFGLINLPGVLFVAAFSLVCPLVMPVPVYQVLYTGYWFWGNLLPPGIFGIPTLSATILTPQGQVRAGYFYGIGARVPNPAEIQPLLGAASVVLLLACAVAALYAAHWLLAWRERRR
jgi:ABC-2 type transport system permease protein